jgi:hypothetical protein
MQIWDLFPRQITLSCLSKNHMNSKYDMAEIFRTLLKKKPAQYVIIPSDNKFFQGLLHIKMFKPRLYTANIVLP